MDRQKKDELVKEIEDLLQSLLSKGMTEMEIAIVLVQDILEPKLDTKKDIDEQLAFAHKPSKYYQ
jgi:hypothetical protein